MPTIEERIQALEQENTARKQENAARKQAEELLTITVRALVSKEAFENLQETIQESQEQNGKLFDVIQTHNVFTNERLGDIQGQIIELDGKIVGQQTETRQHFAEQNRKIIELDGKIVGQQTEMRQRFVEQDSKITGLQTEMGQMQTAMGQMQTAQTEQTALLQQILARLPEKP